MSEINLNPIAGGNIKSQVYDAPLYSRKLNRGGGGDMAAALKKSCENFEAMFISRILKEMRDTIPKSGLVDGGQAEEIYTSMMDAQLAQKIASGKSFGLARKLYEQLSSLNDSDIAAKGAEEPEVSKGKIFA